MPQTTSPKLSVVVPIYNVDRYLDECLASVAAQEVQDFEAILVDDGSTDGSAEIAADWSKRDSRFTLVQQPNGGLGHARNTGVRHVSGDYLAFLDSDDVVPADSYRLMIESLESTGSDFATGNVYRFDSSGPKSAYQAALYNWKTDETLLRTHVTKDPTLLRDHLAHNKVFRTSFWKGSSSAFPEGVLYEDVPATIPAHVRAKAVDVLPHVAILWRVRDQGDSSITQNRNRDARHIRDRVEGMLTASTFIAQHANQKLKDEYDFLALRRDLRWYIDLYPEVDTSYQAELFSSIGRFLAQVSPQALQWVPVNLRPAYALIDAGAHDDFAAFIDMRLKNQVQDLPTVVHDGRAVIKLELPHRTPLSDDIRDVTDQLSVVSKVSDVDVTDTEVVIEGWASLSQVLVSDTQQIKVWFQRGRRKVAANITYRHDARAAADVSAPAEATGRLAFTARVPIKKLRGWPKRRGAAWRTNVAVSNFNIERRAPLRNPIPGKAERFLLRKITGGQCLRLVWSENGLECRIRTEPALLANATPAENGLDLKLETSSRVGPNALLRVKVTGGIDSADIAVTPDNTDKTCAHAAVPVARIPGFVASHDPEGDVSQSWDLFFRQSKYRRWKRVQDVERREDCALVAGDTELVVRGSRTGAAGLAAGIVAPVLKHVSWTDAGVLEITLKHVGNQPLKAVVLRARGRGEEIAFPVVATDTVVTAALPVFSLPRFGETAPLRAGTWDIAGRVGHDTVPVRLASDALDELPQESNTGGRSAIVSDVKRQALCVVIERELQPNERGSANQSRLRTKHYPHAKTTIRDAVLYEVYHGRQFAANPRAIFKELTSRGTDVEHLVVVHGEQVTVPDGATAVPYRSESYYEALAQAQFVVASSHLPSWFSRAEGQTVLQTWHSTGIKKIGLDIDSDYFTNTSYREKFQEGDAANWDYLVSPSPFASEYLPRALAFDGKLLETGAPRNDIFYRADRDAIAASAKRRIGIPDDKNVVLYAPTVRDDLFDGSGRYRFDSRFNLEAAAKQLGDDYTILFRNHPQVSDRLSAGQGRVIDVSDYPDVQELLLVTDTLVTDYTALMCDFAITGRPMIFYTYDLSKFRDTLRGFYLDFEHDVPGPIVMTQAELVSAIADADKIRVEHEAKYQAFQNRFNAWDDGKASSRVVDAVFGSDS